MKRLITLLSFLYLFIIDAKAQYCTPSVISCGEYISNVTLNTINNTSTVFDGCGITSTGYSDYSGISTVMTPGNTYTLSVSLSNSFQGDVVDIWIDYNQNQIFDPGELITTITGYQNNFTGMETQTYSLMVPSNAQAGNARMRVRLRFSPSDASPDACGNLSFGEAEDYTLNISANACTGTPLTPDITTTGPAYACPSSSVILNATDPNTTDGIIYQWQNSASVSGPWANAADAGATTLADTTGSITGVIYYRLIAKCTASSLSSNPSSTIQVAPGTIATITANPANETICAGSSTIFAVNANGTLPAYQWQVNTNGNYTDLTDNSTYSGSATNILSVNNVSNAMSGYSYRCVVTANGCTPSAISPGASLTVQSAPVITTQPAAQYVCPGGNTSFSIAATGTPVLSYQWQVNTGSVYVNVTNNSTYSGATTATLAVSGVTAAMNGYNYRCVVSGACSPEGTSNSASISIGLTPPVITASGNTTICAGDNLYLSAPTGFFYQWYNGANAIPGAIAASYAVTASGAYHVVTSTITGCSGTSSAINITVKTSPNQPNIFALGNTTFCLGSGVLLESDVTSGLPVQWLLDNGMIVGSTATSYNATDSGSYSIQVTGTNGCTATSLPIQTTVYELPVPVISTAGDFNMCVTSGGYSLYQWFLNGVAIPGATGSCYMATGNGSYSVAGYDSLGCSKMSFPTVLSNVGVQSLASIQQSIKVYPNPATDVVHVDAPVKVSLAISSLDGRVVYYEHGVNAMDISKLASGVYMLTVYDEQNTVLKIEKLVKD